MTAEAEYYQHPGRVQREDVKPTRFSVNGLEDEINNNNGNNKPHRMLAPTRTPNDNVVALPEIVHNQRESRVNREQVVAKGNTSTTNNNNNNNVNVSGNNASRLANSGVNAAGQEGESRNDGNFPSLPLARSIPSHFANDGKAHSSLHNTPLAVVAQTQDKSNGQAGKQLLIPHAELQKEKEEEYGEEWHPSWQKQQHEEQKSKEREHHKQEQEQQKEFLLQEQKEFKLEEEEVENNKQKIQHKLSPLHARRVNRVKEDGVNGKRDIIMLEQNHSQHEEEEEEQQHQHLANHNSSFHERAVSVNKVNEKENQEDISHNTNYNINNNSNSHIDRHYCKDEDKVYGEEDADDDDDDGDGDIGISQPLLHSVESSMHNREMEFDVNAPPAVLAAVAAGGGGGGAGGGGLERNKESKEFQSSSSSEASSSSEFSAREGHELQNKKEEQVQAANESNSTGVYYMKRQGKRTSNNSSCNDNSKNVNLGNATRVANAVISSEHSSSLPPQVQLQSAPSSTNVVANNHLYSTNQGAKDTSKQVTKPIAKDVNEEPSTTHRDACMSNRSDDDGVFVEELFSPREGSMSMEQSQSTRLPVLVKTTDLVHKAEEEQAKELSCGVHVKPLSEPSLLPSSVVAEKISVNASRTCCRSDADAIGSPSPLQSQSKVNPEVNNGGGVVPLLSPPMSTSSSDVKRRSRHSVRQLQSIKSGKKSLAEPNSLRNTSTEQENNRTRSSNNSNNHHDNYCNNDADNCRSERHGKHRVKCSCGTCTVMEEH